MAERDLFGVIGGAPLTRDYCGDSYWRWEEEVVNPILKELGYKVLRWVTIDGDSFGPLVRGAVVTKEGVEETLTYG